MRTLLLLSALVFGGCLKPKTQIIQINSIPPPFDVGGRFPYVVWVNGQRVDMPQKDILLLVEKIGKENIKPSNKKDIHIGWLIPHEED